MMASEKAKSKGEGHRQRLVVMRPYLKCRASTLERISNRLKITSKRARPIKKSKRNWKRRERVELVAL